MAISRIEFNVSDPELRVLAGFAVRNDSALTRPENWSQAEKELLVIGWPRDDARELLHSFAKSLDDLHAREHKEAHGG